MKSKYIIPILDLSSQIKSLYEIMNKESDQGCALIGASFLNECLGSVLKKKFRDNSSTVNKILTPDSGFLGSFSNRADLTYSLSLINKEIFSDLKIIAEIRNTFAHSHLKISFDTKDIIDLCDKLNSFKVYFPSKYYSEKALKENPIITSRRKYNTTIAIISQSFLAKGLIDEIKA